MASTDDAPVKIRKVNESLLECCRGKYILAEFLPFNDISDMTIEAVPGYWLHTSPKPHTSCITSQNGEAKVVKTYIFVYIPSKTQNYKKAKVNNMLPDPDTWIKWPVNFVLDKIFDNYHDARAEEIKAEAYPHSDLEGYLLEQTSKGRIKCHKKKWPGDTSSPESDCTDIAEEASAILSPTYFVINHQEADGSDFKEQETKVSKKKKTLQKKNSNINIPSPPSFDFEADNNDVITIDMNFDVNDPETSKQTKANTTLRKEALDINISDIGNNEVANLIAQEAVDKSASPACTFESSSNENPSSILSGIPIGFEVDLEIENIDLLSHLQDGRTNDDFYKACFLRILNQNVEMKKKIEKLENILHDVNEKLCNLSVGDGNEQMQEIKSLVPFPVSTVEELQHLNELLKQNSRYFAYLRNFMTDCCPVPNFADHDSKTIKQELYKVVGHILSRIVSSELAVNLNLCGRHTNPNTPKKEGIKKFPEFLEVTFEAIKPKAKLADFHIDRSQCDAAVGEWLRLSKSRLADNKENKRLKMAQRRAAKNNK